MKHHFATRGSATIVRIASPLTQPSDVTPSSYDLTGNGKPDMLARRAADQ